MWLAKLARVARARAETPLSSRFYATSRRNTRREKGGQNREGRMWKQEKGRKEGNIHEKPLQSLTATADLSKPVALLASEFFIILT